MKYDARNPEYYERTLSTRPTIKSPPPPEIKHGKGKSYRNTEIRFASVPHPLLGLKRSGSCLNVGADHHMPHQRFPSKNYETKPSMKKSTEDMLFFYRLITIPGMLAFTAVAS